MTAAGADPPAELIRRAAALVPEEGRAVLGITGPPGAGKSTLAGTIVSGLGDVAALVPMDGFHLSNRVLLDLGRRGRKGAPDTFDAAGYAELLARLRRAEPSTVYAPDFDRTLDEPVAGSIPVPPDVRLVVTEGNYLLLPQSPWSDVTAQLDTTWYVHVDDEERRRRLVERHCRHGMTTPEATAWTLGTDEPNARLVAATRHHADAVVVVASADPTS